ncbi:unnamed protein product, partial [Ascophyllum nodosum]
VAVRWRSAQTRVHGGRNITTIRGDSSSPFPALVDSREDNVKHVGVQYKVTSGAGGDSYFIFLGEGRGGAITPAFHQEILFSVAALLFSSQHLSLGHHALMPLLSLLPCSRTGRLLTRTFVTGSTRANKSMARRSSTKALILIVR